MTASGTIAMVHTEERDFMKEDNEQKFDLRGFVRKRICEIIDSVDLEKTTRLPSELQLAETLQVSRDTVRTVLTDLANEGRIIRRHGSGTFVNVFTGDIKATLFPSMQYYWNIIENYGYKPSIHLISMTLLPEDHAAAGHLHLPAKAKVMRLERIYCASGRPCIFCRDHFNSRIVDASTNFSPQGQYSIFQILYETGGYTVRWSKTQIKATSTARHPELEPHFNIPAGEHKPLMLFTTISYDKKETPFLYTESYFDSDMIEFSYVQQYGTGLTRDKP